MSQATPWHRWAFFHQPKLRALTWALAASLTLLHASSSAADDQPGGQQAVTLPFHVYNGHMLIDGAVNGKAGKFLFDTGTQFPFFLNNHFLALAKDQRMGSGQTGSGQDMVLYRQDAPLQTLDMADQVHLENVPAPLHTDWGFLEQAYGIPGFLGSIGHGFNHNYLFVIDYDAQTIVFHAQSEGAPIPAGVIDPARVLAALAFTPTGVEGQLPELQLRVGKQSITAYFDTGNQGSLVLTEATKKRLVQQGQLRLTSSAYTYGTHEPATRASLKGLQVGPHPLHDADHLLFTIGSRDRLGLGYQFMKHYVTAWDYQRHTLTLLKP